MLFLKKQTVLIEQLEADIPPAVFFSLIPSIYKTPFLSLKIDIYLQQILARLFFA